MTDLRHAMRRLLASLCDDLEGLDRRAPESSLGLPAAYFRLLGDALSEDAFSNWRVVGWIEELNDLVYFLDVRAQWRKERDRAGFADQFFSVCHEQFFENSYADDLFPTGEPQAAGFGSRLDRLWARLARQVVQESLLLVPGLPCEWLRETGPRSWSVPCDLSANFERAEPAGWLFMGLQGAALEPKSSVRRLLADSGAAKHLRVSWQGIELWVGGRTVPVLDQGRVADAFWRHRPPCVIWPKDAAWPGGLTLGPTLVYTKQDRMPHRVIATRERVATRIARALTVIEAAWPEGARTLATLTSRIIPLDAAGVVSFSYRHRPGLSFLNLFERGQLDLIDDLIHENSHHHLNLLLRQARLRRGDSHREMFYSPWRRSLRPLHGILHATFTFTMGALLFERLSRWGTRHPGAWRQGGLTARDVLRARVRCLEEVESVRYSLHDLTEVAGRRHWLTAAGQALVAALEREIRGVARRMAPLRGTVLRSRFGAELRRHIRTLDEARRTYGLP